jgi:hypothetical protein
MAKWIAGAIRRPGRETARAKHNGLSTHTQMVRDAKSPNKSLAAAGRLGLRLSAMHHHRTIAHGS